MRIALIAALLALQLPARAAPRPIPAQPRKQVRVFTALKPGVYECDVKGMACSACAEAIVEAVAAVDGVEKAEVDFDSRKLLVAVRERKTVSVTALQRALRRAARRIDLGASFDLGEIRYVP